MVTIKSVHLNTRDAGFEFETNDCFVKALQAVTGVPYRDAHAFCKRNGRKDRKGTYIEKFMPSYITNALCIYGFRVFKRDANTGQTLRRTAMYGMRYVPTYDTLSQFVRKHPRGRFLLCSNRHAFTVIDGIVYDNGGAGDRTKVTYIFEFIESSKVEALQQQVQNLNGGNNEAK